jgi:hypothetical protein
MYICYIDEAGCTGALPLLNDQQQPIFTLAGLIIDITHIKNIAYDWIHLKQENYPNLAPPSGRFHDWMRPEIKGCDLRRGVKSGSRKERRFANRIIMKSLDILEKYQVKLCGRVYAKPIGGDFNGKSVYTSTIQEISSVFQHFLMEKNAHGMMIADSRNKGLNSNVSHSIFTQRFRATGDPYERIIELPTFGHSDNHVGLQLADLICSALLFPIAAEVCFAARAPENIHRHTEYLNLRTNYGNRIKSLQYRYRSSDGWWSGGLYLNDTLKQFRTQDLFKQHPAPQAIMSHHRPFASLSGWNINLQTATNQT